MLIRFGRSRVHSVRYALAGILFLVKTEPNAWLHALSTVAVLAAGLWLRLSSMEWCWIAIAIAAVWTVEALNTALELLCDVVSPEIHPQIGRAKDVAAGAVLISAAAALCIGICILGPHLLPITPKLIAPPR